MLKSTEKDQQQKGIFVPYIKAGIMKKAWLQEAIPILGGLVSPAVEELAFTFGSDGL